jgi:hypothetical protein
LKRVELLEGFFIDISERDIALKSELKIIIGKKGEEVESCSSHGYFGSYHTMLKKLAKLLTLKMLKKDNTLKDLKDAIEYVAEEVRALADSLEGENDGV